MVDAGAGGDDATEAWEGVEGGGVEGDEAADEEGADGAGVGGKELVAGKRGLPRPQELELRRHGGVVRGGHRPEEEDRRLRLRLLLRRGHRERGSAGAVASTSA